MTFCDLKCPRNLRPPPWILPRDLFALETQVQDGRAWPANSDMGGGGGGGVTVSYVLGFAPPSPRFLRRTILSLQTVQKRQFRMRF